MEDDICHEDQIKHTNTAMVESPADCPTQETYIVRAAQQAFAHYGKVLVKYVHKWDINYFQIEARMFAS